jgi:hypothetical protein
MRRPNFNNWLARELRYLSGEDTLNLRRLAYLAQKSLPRLKERLILYAIATGNEDRLNSYLYNNDFAQELRDVSKVLAGKDPISLSPKLLHTLPSRYQKALSSYLSAYHRIETKNDSKRLRWAKTVQLQKEKGISNANIYKGLGLDAGNTNAYLKHGDIDRFSLDTATNIMKYVINASG